MKIKELREKNIAELENILGEKRANTIKLRFNIASKQVKNTKELKNEKRDIAKILTLIKEKKEVV